MAISRLDECLLESTDVVRSRIGKLMAMDGNVGGSELQNKFLRPTLGGVHGATSANDESNISSSYGNILGFGIESSLERGLRLFNASAFSHDSSTGPSTNSLHSRSSNNNPNHITRRASGSLLQKNIPKASNSAGIRSMSINPSRTLLAIGSGHPFQVTIYAIPEYEPVGIEVRLPVLTRAEDKVKVRDLSFNKGTGQLMTLTTEGYVKLWDRESYAQISKRRLVHTMETVCLKSNAESNLFAVGSQSHVSIIDPRTFNIVHEINSCDEGWGVRSLDFKSNIITTGGGYGRIGFYDLRAQRYLDGFENGQGANQYLEVGSGWHDHDTIYSMSVAGVSIRNAVYTIEYDSTGTRLFSGGGPLQLGLRGAYAGLWS
ncbi:DDB1- and CUL4-associated factor 12 [Modicella reniformis]|uniref:DDB1- and CUL4-associated factor 12 n=1 Tax=Modicella reniformis TaxID=1440133 RepID=A0A9P6MGU9_9FUNG|nr:DDB1- and CUL4-associated factor 12 [Modicella reniformis]